MPLFREDYQSYGPELIDMTQRAAREALQPELDQIKQRQWDLAQREQRLRNQSIFDRLDQALPGWRQVNTSDGFKQWLNQQEEYSGRRAHDLLIEGFQNGEFSRVLAFFTSYLAAIGQAPATQAQAPAARQQPPARQPTGSRADLIKQLDKLYSDARRGFYNGREAEKNALEARLHAAIHSQR